MVTLLVILNKPLNAILAVKNNFSLIFPINILPKEQPWKITILNSWNHGKRFPYPQKRQFTRFKGKKWSVKVDFAVLPSWHDKKQYSKIFDRTICMKLLKVIKNGLFPILKHLKLPTKYFVRSDISHGYSKWPSKIFNRGNSFERIYFLRKGAFPRPKSWFFPTFFPSYFFAQKNTHFHGCGKKSENGNMKTWKNQKKYHPPLKKFFFPNFFLFLLLSQKYTIWCLRQTQRWKKWPTSATLGWTVHLRYEWHKPVVGPIHFNKLKNQQYC